MVLQNNSVSNADMCASPEREKVLRPILSRFNEKNQFTTTFLYACTFLTVNQWKWQKRTKLNLLRDDLLM